MTHLNTAKRFNLLLAETMLELFREANPDAVINLTWKWGSGAAAETVFKITPSGQKVALICIETHHEASPLTTGQLEEAVEKLNTHFANERHFNSIW